MMLPIVKKRKAILAAASSAVLVTLALPAIGQESRGDELGLLSGLSKGMWALKSRDGALERKICVKSGYELVQLGHSETGCNSFVVAEDPTHITVQYFCPANGYGRTQIRKETASLVQIQTQGVESGSPFEFSAEARRTGPCS